jgi:tRNA dimethylallyltransferase
MIDNREVNAYADDILTQIGTALLVIVGPTASGKSALAIVLAERLGGEILCADSRTVYRGMNIGTAKPSAADQARVPHHGLDLVDPNQSYTAADYKQYAEQKITEIGRRNRVPIIVGGSGLYIDAVLYDYQMLPPADPALRAELTGLDVAALQTRVRDMGLELPADAANPRRLMRIIETGGAAGGAADRQRGVRARTLVLGLDMDMVLLEQRITTRVDDMLAAGLANEVLGLADQYGWDAQAMQAPGYREFAGLADGGQTIEAVRAAIIKNTRAFAKRQKTWFKRNKSIHWLTTDDKLAEAVDFATTFLGT